MGRIKLAIVGVGNCASSLVQGIATYRNRRPEDAVGLMHWEIGGYRASDIQVASAFDVDVRKVGKDVSEAIFEAPNCTTRFCERVPKSGVRVHMGLELDGVSRHMEDFPEGRRFLLSDQAQPDADDVVAVLRESGTEILVNYLPVGSEKAARF
ncbi:MAG: inositol-3-phosphate synthase, partial [Myxococcota bacterium]|nr:inositol-3-phosphate synthase [Myxococcota bacterium]